jgi:hypothetical protein
LLVEQVAVHKTVAAMVDRAAAVQVVFVAQLVLQHLVAVAHLKPH